VAFHAQQAAEKALKALLASRDVPFRKTHSIEELGRASLDVAPELGPIVDAAVPLTEFAWKFRYPGEITDPSRAEAEEAVALARRVVGNVKRILG
jgi:HEPN domain-containing protein